MAVVLMILKILGIILLCILGLLILIITLVLLVPVRYRAEGGYSEEKTAVHLKVRWMIVRVFGDFTKEDGLTMKAKVAWFTVYSMNAKKGEGTGQDHLIETESQPPPENAPATAEADVGNDPATAEGDAGNAAEAETPSEEDTQIFGDGKPEKETKEEKKARKQREKEEKKRLKEEAANAAAAPLEGEVVDEEDSGGAVRDKLDQTRDKIESTMDKIAVKRNHIEQFLAKPFTKKTIERGKKLLIKIFKHLKPKKGHVDLTLGLGSAADTGMILGKAAMFYPLYGKWLFITPDFYYKRIEAEGEVKGRIRLGALAMPALIFYLRKDTRRTIKLAKKI